MSKTEPAFPLQRFDGPRGMTLRDYFAAAVIQGCLSGSRVTEHGRIHSADAGGWAELAYVFADAMIAERDK